MATFSKFNDYAEQAQKGNHNWPTDVMKIMLSNTAPSSSNTVKTDITEISAGNGYTAGGTAVSNLAVNEAAGVSTLSGDQVVFTASGGTIGPFRYVIGYNDTSATDLLVGYWDYGSAVTLNSGETFAWKPNNATSAGSILTYTV